MLVLGIETSCDETGIGLYDTGGAGLLAHAIYSQVAMHEAYGGVVPELASRDHVRRLVPLAREVLQRAGCRTAQLNAIAYTEGPGLAGALLVGTAFAHGLALALDVPAIGVHHLEGHLLSPLLSRDPPQFPFVALLVSGGHTQLMRVAGLGQYEMLGETQDDAAGEAFDKTAKLLGLGYPGGPALSKLAEHGVRGRFRLPRPMLGSGNLDFSFSGLKTAVLLLVRRTEEASQGNAGGDACAQFRADVASAFQDAVTDVLVAKSVAALEETNLSSLVVSGGVGANSELRSKLALAAQRNGFTAHYPDLELCTDNGAMIANAAALRLAAGIQRTPPGRRFSARPRWDLASP